MWDLKENGDPIISTTVIGWKEIEAQKTSRHLFFHPKSEEYKISQELHPPNTHKHLKEKQIEERNGENKEKLKEKKKKTLHSNRLELYGLNGFAESWAYFIQNAVAEPRELVKDSGKAAVFFVG